MIGSIDIKINAAHPELALQTVCAFKSSPSSIRVLGVPKKIGKWEITNVILKAVYPDNSIVTTDCVLTGGVWVGTIQGTDTTGYSENGFSVVANGTDENDENVNGYILGVGDIKIFDSYGDLTPSERSDLMQFFPEEPLSSRAGNVYVNENNQLVFQTSDGDLTTPTVDEVDNKLANYYPLSGGTLNGSLAIQNNKGATIYSTVLTKEFIRSDTPTLVFTSVGANNDIMGINISGLYAPMKGTKVDWPDMSSNGRLITDNDLSAVVGDINTILEELN